MTRKLIVREGSSERVFTLSSPMSVGRDEDCAITLEDPRLSRHHAEFAANGTVVSVRDLQSRNGIEINGVRLPSAVLRGGDVVTLAGVSITYVEEAEPGAPDGADRITDDRTVLSAPPMAARAAFPRSPSPAPVDDDDATRHLPKFVPGPAPVVSTPPSHAPVRPRVVESVPLDAPAEPAPRTQRLTWGDQVLVRVAVLTIFVALMGLLGAWKLQRDLLTSTAEARATVIVNWLAAEAAAPPSNAMNDAVQSVGKEPGVVAAVIIANDGHVIAPTSRLTQPIVRIPGLDAAPADVQRLRVVEHDGRLELARPVAGANAVAWLTYSPADAGGSLGLVAGLLLLTGAAATFFTASAIRRTTIDGVARFKDDVELVMSGRLTRATDTLGMRPFEDLANVVNYLVTRVKAGGGLQGLGADAADGRPDVAAVVAREAWIIADAAFKVTEASASIAQILGVRSDTLLGKHILDAIPDREISEAILKCLSGVSLHGRDETVLGSGGAGELAHYTVSVSRKGRHDPITIRFAPRTQGGRA
ncbi:MAG: FHA domain-containing protein [Vicinamibacterales bacterium]